MSFYTSEFPSEEVDSLQVITAHCFIWTDTL